MTTKPTTKLFNYLRGAIRGAYGVEDFRDKKVLIIGVDSFGQDMVSKICFDESVKLYFLGVPGKELENYLNAFTICTLVEPWGGEDVDITIDTIAERVVINGTAVCFTEVGEEPYVQGIHDFSTRG